MFEFAAQSKVWWPAEITVGGSDPDVATDPVSHPFRLLVSPRTREEQRALDHEQMKGMQTQLSSLVGKGFSPEQIEESTQKLVDDATRDEAEIFGRIHGWADISLNLPDGSKHLKYNADALRFALRSQAFYRACATAVDAASRAAVAKN